MKTEFSLQIEIFRYDYNPFSFQVNPYHVLSADSKPDANVSYGTMEYLNFIYSDP